MGFQITVVKYLPHEHIKIMQGWWRFEVHITTFSPYQYCRKSM